MRFLAMACALVLLMGAAPDPAHAAIGEAVVTADLNLRSGPGTGYPVVATLPAGSLVTVNACLPDRKWCDVTWRGRRGWAFAAYLAFRQRVEPGPWIGGPVILYDYGDYLDRHRRYKKHDRRDRRPRGDWPRGERPHREPPHHDGQNKDWRKGDRDRHERRPRPKSGSYNPTLPGVGPVPGRSHPRPPELSGSGGERFRERPRSGIGGGCDPASADCGQPRRERRGSVSVTEQPSSGDSGQHQRRRRDHSGG